MSEMKFQPLTDLWESYVTMVTDALANDDLEDMERVQTVIWPTELHISEDEQLDIQSFMNKRLVEIVKRSQEQQKVDLNVLASYFFYVLLVGMLWERERIGR